ncbi:MAG: hypothetical protein EOO39_18140 [Cytophagaceae bacterium]|nr:MAG: hypothetical protein EOO39_18140 [Cytophagaceae bacterium]
MWNELLQQGIVTQAVPYDRYATYSGRNSTRSNYILYRFHADTVSRTFSRAVSQREYDTMPTREKVLVTYLPGTRGQIWEEGLASPERRNTNVAGEIIGTLIDGVVWLLCISVTSCSHTRQLHLLREGIAVPGVVRAALVFRRGKSNRYMVQYSYDAGNKEQAGEMVLPEAQYRRIAGANTHFTVLYNAAHPHEPIPYSLITDAYLIASAGGRNA